jgi:hypothetical protein
MILVTRAPQAPSSAVVAFRDALEEASATARARRADDDASAPTAMPARVAAPVPPAPPASSGVPAATEPLPDTTPPPAQ